MPDGVIIEGIGGFYYVRVKGDIYECKAKGIFRKDNIVPLTGDRVNISIIDEDKKIGNLDTVLPRESTLIRPAVANINLMAIVISVESPATDFLLLDKLLITAHIADITPILCINKIDLSKSDEHKAIEQVYKKANYNIVFVSAVQNKGLDKLNNILSGKIAAFAGQSGVGKSSILNKILDSSAMETGELSKKIGRGKHTTRHTELLELKAGGYILDTPGFSSYELSGVEASELKHFYPEFEKFEGTCRFKGCIHHNEPDCGVKKGIQDGLIDEGRYLRYIELYNILKTKNTKKG